MARDGIDYAALAQALKPYILPWISAPSTVAGTVGGGLTAHALSGPYHSGLLSDAQAPQFLLADGSRPLTGNLVVAGGVTLDGVDLSAHAADANAHHGQDHLLASDVGLGPDHSIAGAAIGAVLRASASDAARFERLFYSDLQGAGSTLDLVGWTGTDVIGKLTPSSDVSDGGSAVLRSDAGALTLQTLVASVKLQSPLLDTASGDLALSPESGVTTLASVHASTRVRPPLLENAAGDLKLDASTDLLRIQPSVRLQSDNYASQVTGWGIDYAGGADFRYLFVDEMHAKSFIADLEQALAGARSSASRSHRSTPTSRFRRRAQAQPSSCATCPAHPACRSSSTATSCASASSRAPAAR